MADYKLVLGYISTAVALFTYVMYLWAVYKGTAKPHGFTWFIWGTINVIGFAAVTVAGGETGAWILAANALGCYTIAIVAFYQKHVTYDRLDWLALSGAFIGIFLWWLTDDPLYAVVLISISDVIGIIPTIRKAYRLPFDENVSSFVVSVLYYVLAIIALDSYHITNWLYHVTATSADIVLVTITLLRRKQKNRSK